MSSVAERQSSYTTELQRFAETGTGAPAWLRELRARGAERFRVLGFPTTRQEEWRFTPVSFIADTPFRLAESVPTNAADVVQRIAVPGAVRVVLLNGRFSPELSLLDGLPAGARVMSLAGAIAADLPECRRLGQATFETHPFVALNTAFLADGIFIAIADNLVLEAPIHVIAVSGGAEKLMIHPRSLVTVGANSQASIAQTFVGAAGEPHFTNAVTEVAVGENAVLDFCTDQREPDNASHVASLHAIVGRSAQFRSRTVTLGGRLVRNDLTAVLDGEGGHAALEGVYLADGERLVDNHTSIDHATPHCTSHELYKGILDGRSRAVFNGRIIVRLDAQKTDAKQTNRALLLSEEAQINSNPQLEIFADDVKCTHGAAVGQLDEDAMFYLRARGLTAAQARDLLIHAYAGEVLNGIPIDALRAQLERDLFVGLERDLAAHGN